uniref:Cytochrome b n=1 Tax=Bulbochaete rectangularis var. hiloensis TaxID=55990 RepID=A0A6M4SR49_9CHLO|nr:apocytochrome b [Bulbochaete rectangularis var. hiloensis]
MLVINTKHFLFAKGSSGNVQLRYALLRQPLLSVVNDHIVIYPTPSNLNISWNWGSLAGICLVVQIITGVLLAMHYAPHVDLAFSSVQHIMRDVPSGWLLRYIHANGASLFFIVVYLHIFKGFFYSSYARPRELLWIIGVIILLLMIATAFMGYVLPWGQMSLWGATVITSLASAIPVVGNYIVAWLWGGFSVDNATLNRFYSIHYLMPFILAGLVILHLAALHQYGSTNPIGVPAQADQIPFHPYYTSKDILGVMSLALFAAILVFFYPDILSHPDNNIPANPYSTPAHIVPEWYFLWVYAILRSIPNKFAGVAAIALVFISLFLLPFLHLAPSRSAVFRPVHEFFFWTFIADCFILTWIGQQPVQQPYIIIGQIATVWFFMYLLIITPLVGLLEHQFSLYNTNEKKSASGNAVTPALL